jgi:hypothetical protein
MIDELDMIRKEAMMVIKICHPSIFLEAASAMMAYVHAEIRMKNLPNTSLERQ